MDSIYRTIETNDWITILIFGSLLFVLVAKSLFYSRFLNFIILPFNNKYIFMYKKKEKLFNWFHVFLTFFQIINTSLFIYLFWRIYVSPENSISPFLYPLILIGYFLFLTLKVALQLGNGFIFGSYRTFSELVFKKLSYLNYSAIVLFIANIVLTYIFIDNRIVAMTATLLFILVNLIGWVTVIRNSQKLITNYFFYFILYLCALEIAPLIVMGSFLK
ncbi:MAG: DUF4271 domain-containing protein [Maribacter sp.]